MHVQVLVRTGRKHLGIYSLSSATGKGFVQFMKKLWVPTQFIPRLFVLESIRNWKNKFDLRNPQKFCSIHENIVGSNSTHPPIIRIGVHSELKKTNSTYETPQKGRIPALGITRRGVAPPTAMWSPSTTPITRTTTPPVKGWRVGCVLLVVLVLVRSLMVLLVREFVVHIVRGLQGQRVVLIPMEFVGQREAGFNAIAARWWRAHDALWASARAVHASSTTPSTTELNALGLCIPCRSLGWRWSGRVMCEWCWMSMVESCVKGIEVACRLLCLASRALVMLALAPPITCCLS
jgi:hypothetical protein